MSNDIVEKVAREIVRSRGLDPDEPTFASGNSSGEYLVYNRRYDGEKLAAKAAIRATLEFYRDNVTAGMSTAAWQESVDNGGYADSGEFVPEVNDMVVKAVFVQALTELYEETV